MRKAFVGVLLCTGLLALGCAKSDPKPKPSGGIQINVPGVNISVDPQGGAEVNAPGVNLKASREGGAEVKAPNVSIKANSKGAEVNVSGKDDTPPQ